MNDKRKSGKQVLVLVTVLCVILVCLLPRWLLKKQGDKELNVVKKIPVEWYQSENSALAKEASKDLTKVDKLRIIRGDRKSESSIAEEYEMSLKDYEAVSMAKKKIKKLYNKGKYPVNLSGGYKKWYTWQAKPWKAVDGTFHSYAVYYWEITFEKYDKSKTYNIYMLEDGTIFTF